MQRSLANPAAALAAAAEFATRRLDTQRRMRAMDADLIARARAARERAHAPYSKFAVGAAVKNTAGEVFTGANVENASYPAGWCAETSAIAAMVAATPAGPGRRIAAMAVVADRIGGRLTTPCGGCRQRIAEFAGPDTAVHVADPAGKGQTFLMKDLLPAAFALDDGK
jgi:cytidine deaminase